MSLPDLRVNLTLNADSFEVTASRAGRTIDSLSRRLDTAAVSAGRAEGAFHNIGSSFKSTIITLGALRFALMDMDDFLLSFPKSVAAAGGEFQRLQTMMEGLSKSTDEATRKMEAMRDVASVINFAKNAPFDAKALADTFVKLKSAGLDPMAGSMDALVNSVAKFGGSSETLKRAAVAIQQMSGKGVISMEELRQQLGEAVPNAMELMARGMGMSMGELTEAVSKGTVKSSTALARMFAQMQLDANGAAEKMMGTLPGALSRLRTEFELFQKTASEQGFMQALTSAAQELSAALSSDEGKQFAKDVGIALRDVTEGLISMSRWIIQNIGLIGDLAKGLAALYGGSKLANLFNGYREQAAAIRAEQKRDADQAQAQRNSQIASLQKEAKRVSKEIESVTKAAADKREQMLAAETSKVAESSRKRIEYLEAEERRNRANFEKQLLRQKQMRTEIERLNALSREASPGPQFNPLGAPKRFGAQQSYLPAMGDVASGLRNDRVAALQREIEQSKALATEHRNLMASAAQLVSSERQHTLSLNEKTTALDREAAKLRESLNAHNEKIRALQQAPTIVAQSTSAVVSFGKTMLLSLGWTAAFAVAIEGAMALFDMFTKKAREAEAAQMAFNRAKVGASIEGDEEKILNRRMTAEKELANLRMRYNAALRNAGPENKGKGAEAARAALPGLSADMDKQIEIINSSVVAQTRAAQNLANAKVQSDTATFLSSVRATADAQLRATSIFKEYESLELRKAEAKTPEDKAKIDKEYVAIGQRYAKARRDAYEYAAAEGLKTLGTTNDKLRDAINSGLNKERIALATAYDNTVSEDTKLVGKKKEKKGPQEDQFADFVAQQRIALAKVKSDAKAIEDGYVTIEESMSKAAAIVDEMIKGDKLSHKGKRPLNDADKKFVIDLLAQREQMEQALQGVKAMQSMERELALSQERVETAFSDGTSVKSSRQETAVDKLIARLEPQKEAINKLLQDMGTSWDKFTQKLRSNAAAITAADFMTDTQARIVALQDELEVDEEARERRKTAVLIQELQKRLNAQIANIQAAGTLTAQDEARIDQMRDAAERLKKTYEDALNVRLMTPLQRMQVEWSNGMKNMQQAAAGWMDSFVDRLATGKLQFGEFVQGILQDIAKIQLKQQLSGILGEVGKGVGSLGKMLGLSGGIGSQSPRFNATGAMVVTQEDASGASAIQEAIDPTKGLFDSIKEKFGTFWDNLSSGFSSIWDDLSSGLSGIWDSISGMFSGAGGGGGDFMSTIMGFFGFANGGIMTGAGPLQLRKYANGGIARSPQLALYGEGKRPEAYVPLPDGRTIPVTMSGQVSGATSAPAVTVNVINQSGTPVKAEQRGQRFDGRQMVLDVVLTGASTPGPFRDNLRNVMSSK